MSNFKILMAATALIYIMVLFENKFLSNVCLFSFVISNFRTSTKDYFDLNHSNFSFLNDNSLLTLLTKQILINTTRYYKLKTS